APRSDVHRDRRPRRADAARAVPARHLVGIRPRLPHQLARRVEDAGDGELLIDRRVSHRAPPAASGDGRRGGRSSPRRTAGSAPASRLRTPGDGPAAGPAATGRRARGGRAPRARAPSGAWGRLGWAPGTAPPGPVPPPRRTRGP